MTDTFLIATAQVTIKINTIKIAPKNVFFFNCTFFVLKQIFYKNISYGLFLYLLINASLNKSSNFKKSPSLNQIFSEKNFIHYTKQN